MAELDDEDRQAIDLIAQRLVTHLRDEHVIPAVLPAVMGEEIRAANSGRNLYWRFSIPLGGSGALLTDWTLMADGGLHLELCDSAGQIFWRGTLRPAPPAPAKEGGGDG